MTYDVSDNSVIECVLDSMNIFKYANSLCNMLT